MAGACDYSHTLKETICCMEKSGREITETFPS